MAHRHFRYSITCLVNGKRLSCSFWVLSRVCGSLALSCGEGARPVPTHRLEPNFNVVGVWQQAGGSRAASGGAMPGLMQDHPLVVSGLLDYAVKVHGDREIVSRTIEDPSKIHRCMLLQPARAALRRVSFVFARLSSCCTDMCGGTMLGGVQVHVCRRGSAHAQARQRAGKARCWCR